MSGFFQSEIDEIKEILNLIKNFIKSNNKSIQITEYYITLGTKTLLEVVEDTLNDPNVDEEQKKEHAELMKTFLQKLKNPLTIESPFYLVCLQYFLILKIYHYHCFQKILKLLQNL